MNDTPNACPPSSIPSGQIFATHADLTQIAADAVVITTSTRHEWTGHMMGAFKSAFGFEGLWQKAAQDGVRLRKIGDTAWLPLHTDAKPRGILITVCTEASRVPTCSLEERRSLPVRAAIQNAFTHLRALGLTHRLLIALPLMRFGKGGDLTDTLGSARHQIAAARSILDELAQQPDWQAGADVVFVAYTLDHYQVVLEARRLEQQRPQVSTPLPVNFDDLLRALRNDEGVLFVGAGMSADTGLKGYNALIQHMAKALGETLATNDQNAYLDLAQWFREKNPGAMGDLIASLFGSQNTLYRPKLAHYLFLALSVRYVVTTNYDDLLERTLHALRRFPVKVVTDAEIAQTGRRDGTFVVKMHGDADHCKGKTDAEDQIVVSRDDYDQFFAQKPMMASLLEGLLLNKTFLFVGYSLRDPNFRQIYAKIAHTLREAKQPVFAVTFERLSDPAVKQWNNKQVYPIAIPGTTPEEQSFHFACLLDYIAEQVVGDTHLWLTPQRGDETANVPSSLERTLREAGRQVVHDLSASHPLNEQHAQRLFRTLQFLTEQGWRPETGSLSALWERIAEGLNVPGDKRRCLIHALAHAESADVIERLRKKLSENSALDA